MAYDTRDGFFSARNVDPRRMPMVSGPVLVQDDPYLMTDAGMGVDYGARYSRPDYQSPRTAMPGAPDMSEVQRRKQTASDNDMAIRRHMAGPSDEVARYLADGYGKDREDLNRAVQLGDQDQAKEIIGRIQSFRDAHKERLLAWASQKDWGGELLSRFAGTAETILDNGFLKDPISIGYDGAGRPVQSISVQQFLSTGINTVGNPVANFVVAKVPELKSLMEQDALAGDFESVRSKANELKEFVDTNRAELTRMAQFGKLAGEAGAAMAETAKGLVSGRYWDETSFDYSSGKDNEPPKQYSLRNIITGEGLPETAKRVAARQTANKYEVSEKVGRMLSDFDDPAYSVFAPLVKQISDATLAQRGGQGNPDAANKVRSAVSALQLTTKHYMAHKDEWGDDLENAGKFYQGVYQGFPGMSEDRLNVLYRQYRHEMGRTDFSDTEFFQDWANATSSVMPTEKVVLTDEKGNAHTLSKQTELVRPERAFYTVTSVADRLEKNGNFAPFQKVSAATREAMQRVDALERQLGKSFESLGYNHLAEDHAVGAISGEDGQSDLDRFTRDNEQIGNLLNMGATQGSGLDVGGQLPKAAEGVRNAALETLVASGLDNASFGEKLGDLDFVGTLAGNVSESLQNSIGGSRSMCDTVAKTIVNSWVAGAPISVRTALEVVGKKVRVEAGPDGTRRLVRTEPRAFVDPATGKTTDMVPDAKVSAPVGFLSTDPAIYRSGDGVDFRAKFAAKQELAAMADGSSSVFEGMPKEAAGAVRNLAKDIYDTQRAQVASGRRSVTKSYDADVGAVISANLKMYDSSFVEHPFISDGSLVTYLEGHDKTVGAGEGESSLNRRAVGFMSDIAERLMDKDLSTETQGLYISLLADTLVVAANRRQLNFSGELRDDNLLGGLLKAAGVLALTSKPVYVAQDFRTPGEPPIILSHNAPDDKDMESYRKQVSKLLRAEFGAPEVDALNAAGYHRTSDGKITNHNDIGAPLARFLQLYRNQPVHNKGVSDGENRMDNAPGDLLVMNDADEANAKLSSLMSSDDKLNGLNYELMRAISASSGDSSMAKELYAQLQPVMEQLYNGGQGYKEARDFVRQQGTRVPAYMPSRNSDGSYGLEYLTIRDLYQIAASLNAPGDLQVAFDSIMKNKDAAKRFFANMDRKDFEEFKTGLKE